jgi:hypothetical protein
LPDVVAVVPAVLLPDVVAGIGVRAVVWAALLLDVVPCSALAGCSRWSRRACCSLGRAFTRCSSCSALAGCSRCSPCSALAGCSRWNRVRAVVWDALLLDVVPAVLLPDVVAVVGVRAVVLGSAFTRCSPCSGRA